MRESELKNTTFNEPDLAFTTVLISEGPDFLDEK
jgi:hypothetical protein